MSELQGKVKSSEEGMQDGKNQSKSLQMVCTVQIVEKESFQGIQIPKSNKCLLEGIPGIAAHGIRNPSEDWNPESKSH